MAYLAVIVALSSLYQAGYMYSVKGLAGTGNATFDSPSHVTGGTTVLSNHVTQQTRSQASVTYQTSFLFILGATDTSNRYNCATIFDTEFTFHGLNVNISFSVPDYVHFQTFCKIAFGNGDVISGYLPSAHVFLNYTYRESGVYDIVLSCRKTNAHPFHHCPHEPSSCLTNTTMFDPVLKSKGSPLRIYATDILEIKAAITLTEVCKTEKRNFTFTWKVFRISRSYTMHAFKHFKQPNGVVLMIPPHTLHPGLHIVICDVEIRDEVKGERTFASDYLYVSIVLPELVATLAGGSVLTFPKGHTFTADGTGSRDPVTKLTSITSLPLSVKWHVYCLNAKNDDVYKYMARYTTSDLNSVRDASVSGGNDIISFDVSSGDAMLLQFNTSLTRYPVCLIELRLERGLRSAITLQALLLTDEPFFVSVLCVSNCLHGRHNKMAARGLQLDSSVTSMKPEVKARHAQLSWSVSKLTEHGFTDVTSDIETETGLTGKSLSLTQRGLEEGVTYRFTATLGKSSTSIIRTVNNQPYGGACTLDKTNGAATVEEFTGACSNWKDDGERNHVSDGRTNEDTNPVVLYIAVQITSGAALKKETIAISRMPTFRFVAKLGDPENSFFSTIRILVVDQTKDATATDTTLQVFDSFRWSEITKSEDGSQIVKSFFNFFSKEVVMVQQFGDAKMAVTMATSAASQLYHIPISSAAPAVPVTLEDNNDVLLDLANDVSKVNGESEEQAGFSDLFSGSMNSSIDPATEAIQEFVEMLTEVVVIALPRVIDLDSDGPPDQRRITLIVSSFINMIARPDFASNITKSLVVSETTVLTEMSTREETEDPEKKEAADGLVVLSGTTVDAVVPDSLDEARAVYTMVDARNQIDAILAIKGGNLTEAVYRSDVSPDERSYLYLKLQRQLHYKLAKEKDLSEETASSSIQIARDVHNATELCSTCSVVIGGDNSQQFLIRRPARDLGNILLNTTKSSVKIPSLKEQGDDSISASVTYFGKNLFMYDDGDRSSQITSGVTHVDLISSNAYTSLDYVTYEQTLELDEPLLVVPAVPEEDASQFSLHKFVYRSSEDDVCLIVNPTSDTVDRYEIYVKQTSFPTIINYDVQAVVSELTTWHVCIAAAQMGSHTGMTFLGVRTYLKEEAFGNENDTTLRTLPPYHFSVFTVACTVWSEEDRRWDSNKCQLEYLPSAKRIRCHCKDVTDLVFGNSFFRAPNSIDFSTLYLKFSPLSQAAVMATLLVVYVTYFIVAIWARRKDRKDILKWGITPLVDNSMEDEYFYIVKVFTGMRPWAGTRSRVMINVAGDQSETGVRQMYDGVREAFSTGSVVEFIMSTGKDLGGLDYVRVWHDNSGRGNAASWYLSRVVIDDLQRHKSFTFLCERWLAVELGGSRCIDCVVAVSGKENLQTFTNRFFMHIKDRLSDGHMWVSLVYRPITSSFTRVQRASCVLLYTLLCMVASAMYFDSGDEYETQAVIEVGPFRFSLEELYISLVSALVTTPTTMAVVLLFRRSKRSIRQSPDQSPFPKDPKSPCCPCLSEKGRSYDERLQEVLVIQGDPAYQGFYLPHFCNYVAWLLALGGASVCSGFVMLYSIDWGKQKSERWLTTTVLSLLESITVIDSFLVIVTAMLLAVVCRSIPREQSPLDTSAVKSTDKYYPREKDIEERVPLLTPMASVNIERARHEALHEIEMRRTLKDILVNLLFLWVLFSIGYSNRDDRSYYLHQNIVNTLHTTRPNTTQAFNKIRQVSEFYSWLNDTVIPNLFPELDINGQQLHWTDRELLADAVNYKLGPPRLRQLRTRKALCPVSRFQSKDCKPGYDLQEEETDWFCIGWKPRPCPAEEPVYNFSSAAWQFTSALDIWGLPVPGHIATYGGGGYIAVLDVSRSISVDILNELYRFTWIDGHTRAVVLEFTIYSPGVNIFVYNMFLVEFPETGGAVTSFSVLPLRIYQHMGPLGKYVLACEILFLVHLLVLCVLVVMNIYEQRRKFCKGFWTMFDLCRLCFSISAVGLYFARRAISLSTIERFQADRKQFVEFRHIALIDQAFVVNLGFLVSLATLRILKILGSNKNVLAVVKIFSRSSKDLFWIGCLLIYVFVDFAFLAYHFFGAQLSSYRNFLASVSTLFISILGKNKFSEMNQTDPLLAKLFFVIFTVTIVLLMVSIFLTTLAHGIDVVVYQTRKDDAEEVVLYVWRKLKSFFVGVERKSDDVS